MRKAALVHYIPKAHAGPPWAMDMGTDFFVTGGSDRKSCMWQLPTHEEMEMMIADQDRKLRSGRRFELFFCSGEGKGEVWDDRKGGGSNFY